MGIELSDFGLANGIGPACVRDCALLNAAEGGQSEVCCHAVSCRTARLGDQGRGINPGFHVGERPSKLVIDPRLLSGASDKKLAVSNPPDSVEKIWRSRKQLLKVETQFSG